MIIGMIKAHPTQNRMTRQRGPSAKAVEGRGDARPPQASMPTQRGTFPLPGEITPIG